MGWGHIPEAGQTLPDQYLAVGAAVDAQSVAFPPAVEAAAKGEHNLAPMAFSSSDPSVLDLT